MIYETPDQSSPIRQGDIFIRIPIVELPTEELVIIGEDDTPQTLVWEEFASANQKVAAILAVRPTIGIVGTQECDALRAPDITLFEVRPFREVERKSKETTKPSKWVPILTQHARVNQKWFYLPADEKIGFPEKMGADFLTPIRIPRAVLASHINLRIGRLNEVARQHFRERIAEFFRRYAYDEWYPLTLEEFAEYKKNNPDVEAFPWQKEAQEHTDKEDTKPPDEEAASDYLAQIQNTGTALVEIMNTIAAEFKKLNQKLNKHNQNSKVDLRNVAERNKILMLIASDINLYSRRLRDVLPGFEKNIAILTESYSEHVLLIDRKTEEGRSEMEGRQRWLEGLLERIKITKDGLIILRNKIRQLYEMDANAQLNQATLNMGKVLDKFSAAYEEFESFGLKILFIIKGPQ